MLESLDLERRGILGVIPTPTECKGHNSAREWDQTSQISVQFLLAPIGHGDMAIFA